MNIRKQSPIATAVGVLVLGVIAVNVFCFFPKETSYVCIGVLKVVGYAGCWYCIRASKPLQRFAFAVVALPLATALIIWVVVITPETGRASYFLALTGALAWFFLAGEPLRGRRKEIALYVVRVAGASLLVIALLPMVARGGDLRAALAVWIVIGVYAIWCVVKGSSSLSEMLSGGSSPYFVAGQDPWRWSRDNNGNWRA